MQPSFYAEYLEIEDSHWWFRGRRQVLAELLRRRVHSPVRLLDVGSSGGSVTQALMELGPVTACDLDPGSAAAARRRPGLSLVVGRAEALPFEDHSFDLVTAFDVIEHIDDDLGALQEIARVVRPTGAVAVAVPAYEWMWGRQDEVNGHIRRYTRRLLRRRLEAAGLSVERTTSFNSFLFPPIAAIRLVRRLNSGRGEGQDRAGGSDFSMTRPGMMNNALTGIFAAERWALCFMDLPVGVSLFAFARLAPK
jgi:SAM-dependent methyltransferase